MKIGLLLQSKMGIELSTPETKKLIGSTENKITKDKNGENVPHLEITEVALVHCHIVNSAYQEVFEYYIHFFQINRLVAC